MKLLILILFYVSQICLVAEERKNVIKQDFTFCEFKKNHTKKIKINKGFLNLEQIETLLRLSPEPITVGTKKLLICQRYLMSSGKTFFDAKLITISDKPKLDRKIMDKELNDFSLIKYQNGKIVEVKKIAIGFLESPKIKEIVQTVSNHNENTFSGYKFFHCYRKKAHHMATVDGAFFAVTPDFLNFIKKSM